MIKTLQDPARNADEIIMEEYCFDSGKGISNFNQFLREMILPISNQDFIWLNRVLNYSEPDGMSSRFLPWTTSVFFLYMKYKVIYYNLGSAEYSNLRDYLSNIQF